MNNESKIRWEQRFNNFKRAYILLQEVNEKYALKELDQFGEEAMIQRFEFCLELAWRTINDFLSYQGIKISIVTPRVIIKEAVASKLIKNGELWMNAIDDRNLTNHTYSFAEFKKILIKINKDYILCFEELYETFLLKIQE